MTCGVIVLLYWAHRFYVALNIQIRNNNDQEKFNLRVVRCFEDLEALDEIRGFAE